MKSAADNSELDHFSIPHKCLLLFYFLIVRQKTTRLELKLKQNIISQHEK